MRLLHSLKWTALQLLGLVSIAQGLPRVLLFTATAPNGYRHDSIPVAVDTITAMGNGSLPLDAQVVDSSLLTTDNAARWETVHSEDTSLFEQSDYLGQFDLVAFVHTTDANPPLVGSLLTDAGAKNLCTYFTQGGGFVGIHSASATLFSYGCFGRVVGAFFDYHPELQNFTISAVDTTHLSTSKLPENFLIEEELYHFRSDPRSMPTPAQVLVTNTSSVKDPGVNLRGFRLGSDGSLDPHPLAWYREGNLLTSVESDDALAQTGSLADNLNGTAGFEEFGSQPAAGRSWYSSMGHANATWALPAYRGHVLGGFVWVLQSSTTKANNASATVGQASTGSTTSSSSSSSSSSTSSSKGSSESNAVLSPLYHQLGSDHFHRRAGRLLAEGGGAAALFALFA